MKRTPLLIDIPRTATTSVRLALDLRDDPRHVDALCWRKMCPRRFERSFVFAFVRHPYERIQRQYQGWGETNPKFVDIDDYVKKVYDRQEQRFAPLYSEHQHRCFWPQSRWVCESQGKRIVDFVGRFENLEEDFQHVCEQVGVDEDLPHRNRTGRPLEDTPLGYESKTILQDWFADDFYLFGFQP